jgi:hypothetical protein
MEMLTLEEKDAIREVLAEYCFRLDDGRFADMAALFTEDGTWDTAFARRPAGRRLPSWRAVYAHVPTSRGLARSIW